MVRSALGTSWTRLSVGARAGQACPDAAASIEVKTAGAPSDPQGRIYVGIGHYFVFDSPPLHSAREQVVTPLVPRSRPTASFGTSRQRNRFHFVAAIAWAWLQWGSLRF